MDTLMNLLPGRVVVIKEGFGLIPVAVDVEDTIAFAAKKYAITASGILLTEADYRGLASFAHQQELKPSGFHISTKARRLQATLLLPLEAPYSGTILPPETVDGFDPKDDPLELL